MDAAGRPDEEAPLDADLLPLARFVGTWRGEGRGGYPTVAPFRFREEIRFWHRGTRVLLYAQRAWGLEDGMPRHGELGLLRPGPDGTVELVIAHPTGHAEVATGRLVDGRIRTSSLAVVGTPSARDVRRIERTIALDGDRLRYELRMAAGGQPLALHLEAELLRIR